MVAAEMSTLAGNQEAEVGQDKLADENTLKELPNTKGKVVPEKDPALKLSSGYMYRQPNWQIGRAAERAKITVRSYKRGDRWLAWRKAQARKAKNAAARGLRRRK